MTQDAIPCQTAASAESAGADPRIAVAEMWLCMLGGLREIARRFSRFLVHEVMPYRRSPQAPFLALRYCGNPMAAFRRVLRTLRFAAVLSLKIETQIAAWKAGAPFDLEGFLSQAPRVSPRAKSGRDAAARDEEDEEDLEEYENLEEWEDLEDREYPERFKVKGSNDRDQSAQEDKEEARYQALLRGPLKDAIAEICKELGLKPDWSLWTDQGFPPPPGGEVEDWVAFFVPEAAVTPTPPPRDDGRGPPPPRYAAEGRPDKPWRSAWPPPDPRDRAPPPYRTATWPPDPGGST